MPTPDGFRISTFCHGGGCVAVGALADGTIAIQDTKVSAGPVLTFTAEEWSSFVAGVKDGQFDLGAMRRSLP
jgi:hypothetical protein